MSGHCGQGAKKDKEREPATTNCGKQFEIRFRTARAARALGEHRGGVVTGEARQIDAACFCIDHWLFAVASIALVLYYD